MSNLTPTGVMLDERNSRTRRAGTLRPSDLRPSDLQTSDLQTSDLQTFRPSDLQTFPGHPFSKREIVSD